MRLNKSDMHNYQDESVNHIIDHPHCGLFLDMGLGKTVSSLTAINYLMFEDLDVEKTLVIAPKRVAESVWSAEIEKWNHLRHLSISKIIGKPKDRLAAIRKRADIYMISRDNIAWLVGQFGGNMLPFDMLVIDESSSFKNSKSLRFKALKRVQPSFKRVVILTGTPAPNGLEDLWTQIWLLDRGERLGRTISEYRRTYFTNVSKSHDYKILKVNDKDSEKQIHKNISDICMSMKTEDYLNLPERIDNFIDIDLPPSILKKYNDFEKEMVLELLESEEEISVLNAAGLSNKLLQFSNGAVYDEDRNYHVMHDLKLDALEEIVENLNGKPVLIAYSYQHDLHRISERLKKYKPVKLKTDQDIRDWNNGKIKVLMMHPASGGHGLNLQMGGSDIVWFGLNWSLELYMQLNKRLHRQGQKFKVRVHHLLTKGTIDQDVKKSLERKHNKQEGLMQAVKARIQKYVKQR